MRGTVYLVGAGPGAVDLLTLRAARLLERADLVIHDALVPPDILALASNARLLNVGKRARRASTDQAFINRLLVRAASRHAVVVRLKGGDPMLFGRAAEEIEACRRAGVPFEIVPGVSAGFAAAGVLQASLTQRRTARSVAFVTPAVARGASADEAWARAAAGADSVVVYMGKGEAVRVRDSLLAQGMAASLPVILAEGVERDDQMLLAATLGGLETLAERAGDGPALLLIGEAFAEAAQRLTSAAPTRLRA